MFKALMLLSIVCVVIGLLVTVVANYYTGYVPGSAQKDAFIGLCIMVPISFAMSKVEAWAKATGRW